MRRWQHGRMLLLKQARVLAEEALPHWVAQHRGPSCCAGVLANDRPAEFDCLAKHLLAAKGDILEAAARAAADETISRRVQSVLKSAVSAGSLADPTWAGNLADYRLILDGFVESPANGKRI